MRDKPNNDLDIPLRKLAAHAAIGAIGGIIVGCLLLLFNVGGLKDLVIASGTPVVAIVVLQLSLASIFSVLEISLAVFLPGRKPGE